MAIAKYSFYHCGVLLGEVFDAALADMYETMVAPHNYYSHLSTFMNAQLCAVVPNLKILETDFDSVPWRDEIITDIPEIKTAISVFQRSQVSGQSLTRRNGKAPLAEVINKTC